MKYMKTFENLDQFDLELAITRIKEEYSEDEVASRFDDEMMNWIEEDWEEDYESEYDWYIDHNNGEAQDVVIGAMIDWYKVNFDKELGFDENYSDLFDAIKSEYGI